MPKRFTEHCQLCRFCFSGGLFIPGIIIAHNREGKNKIIILPLNHDEKNSAFGRVNEREV